jgi:MarR family transcriptional regulator for hemolysin
MSRPRAEPIGRRRARTAKLLTRAFEQELALAGGSLPTWLILLSLKSRSWRTQRELADALGIEGPTLTHHLAGLERAGLVTRTRDADNRRVQQVDLTEAGDAAFQRLRRAASSFDQRLQRRPSRRAARWCASPGDCRKLCSRPHPGADRGPSSSEPCLARCEQENGGRPAKLADVVAVPSDRDAQAAARA